MKNTELETYLKWLHQPVEGSQYEFRCFFYEPTRPNKVSKYGLDANQIDNASQNKMCKTIYTTLNPGVVDKTGSGYLGDANITCCTNLLIDIDAVKVGEPINGVSVANFPSTDREHDQAQESTQKVLNHIKTIFPSITPVVLDTGNGGAIIIPLDNWPNNAERKAAVDYFYQQLVETTGANIDPTTSNASRISRLPGLLNKKDYETSERVFRKAHIIGEVPVRNPLKYEEFLEKYKPVNIPTPPPVATNDKEITNTFCDSDITSSFDCFKSWLESRLQPFNIQIKRTMRKNDAMRGSGYYIYLTADPVMDIQSGSDTDIAVWYGDDKRVGYQIHHNRGTGIIWRNLRAKIDPLYISAEKRAEEAMEEDGFMFETTKSQSPTTPVAESSIVKPEIAVNKTKRKRGFEKLFEKSEVPEINIDKFNWPKAFIKTWNHFSGAKSQRSNAGLLFAFSALSTSLGKRLKFLVGDHEYFTDLRLVDVAASGSNKSKWLERCVTDVSSIIGCEDLGTETLQSTWRKWGYAIPRPKKDSDFEDQMAIKEEADSMRKKARAWGANKPASLFYCDDSMRWLEVITQFANENGNNREQGNVCRLWDDLEPGPYSTSMAGEWFMPDFRRNFFLNAPDTFGKLILDKNSQDSGVVFRLLPIHSDAVKFTNSRNCSDVDLLKISACSKAHFVVDDLPYGTEEEENIKKLAIKSHDIIKDFWDVEAELWPIISPKMAIQAKKIATLLAYADQIDEHDDLEKAQSTIHISGKKFYQSAWEFVLLCHIYNFNHCKQFGATDSKSIDKIINFATRQKERFLESGDIEELKKLTLSGMCRWLYLEKMEYTSLHKRFENLLGIMVTSGMGKMTTLNDELKTKHKTEFNGKFFWVNDKK